MRSFLCALGAVFLISSISAHGESDSDKMVRLEQQLNLLSKKVYGSQEGTVPGIVPGLSDAPGGGRADMEQQVQQLLSRIEVLEHQNETLTTQVAALSLGATHPPVPTEPSAPKKTPVTPKVKKPLSEAVGAASPEATPLPAVKAAPLTSQSEGVKKRPTKTGPEAQGGAPDPDELARIHAQATAQENLPQGTAQEKYNQAQSLLKAGHHEEAAGAFEAFLSQHPDHNLAANATYWLGETHFVRGAYDKAVVIFAQGYQTYGKSSKGPDMLLKVALCLEKQNKKPEACAMMDQLKEGHKVLPPAIDQSAKALKQRLKCT